MTDQRNDGDQQAPDSGEPGIKSGAGYGDHATAPEKTEAPATDDEQSA